MNFGERFCASGPGVVSESPGGATVSFLLRMGALNGERREQGEQAGGGESREAQAASHLLKEACDFHVILRWFENMLFEPIGGQVSSKVHRRGAVPLFTETRCIYGPE